MRMLFLRRGLSGICKIDLIDCDAISGRVFGVWLHWEGIRSRPEMAGGWKQRLHRAMMACMIHC